MSDSSTDMVPSKLPWLLIVLIVCMVLWDVALAINLFGLPYRVRDVVDNGTILGQIAFVCMLGGFWGRTWLAGWWLATSLIMGILTLALTAMAFAFGSYVPWSIILVMPALTLGTSIPCLAIRSLKGWTLTRSSNLQLPRDHRVEDLFTFSIVVACVFAFEKLLPQATHEQVDIWMLATGFLASLVFLWPVAAITFRCSSWTRRLLGYCALLVLFGVWIMIMGMFGMSQREMIEIVSTLPLLVINWLVGNVVLLQSGYRLTSYAPRSSSVASSIAASPIEEARAETRDIMQPSVARWQSRWLTAAIVGIVFVAVVGKFSRDTWSLSRYREMAIAADYFQAAVDRVDYHAGQIVGVVMSKTATEADLRKVAERTPHIQRLTLAGTQLDDKWLFLLDKFPKLTELDLSGTAITDGGLSQLKRLRSLSLADTHVSFLAALKYAKAVDLNKLDLSGTNITDEVIQQAPRHPLNLLDLKMARNPITDNGVKALLEHRIDLRTLDLSDTQVVGHCFENQACPWLLILDGTLVDDAVLRKLLAVPNFSGSISLRRTGITAAVLPMFNGRGLALGHGKITEADLLKLPRAAFDVLKLNGPEFTGEALTTGKILVSRIDLSGSGVTDEILKKFYVLGWTEGLRLSHTNVSVGAIGRLNSTEVDLRDTKITGAEVLSQIRTLPYGRILLRHEACSPEELLELDRVRSVMMDTGSQWPEW